MKSIISILIVSIVPSFATAATTYFSGTETTRPAKGKPTTQEVFISLAISDKKDAITQTILRRTATKGVLRRETTEIKKGLDGTWTSVLSAGTQPQPTVVTFAANNLVSMSRVATAPNGRKASINVTFPHPRVFQLDSVVTETSGAKLLSASLEAGEILETQFKKSTVDFKFEDIKPGTAPLMGAQRPAGAPVAPAPAQKK